MHLDELVQKCKENFWAEATFQELNLQVVARSADHAVGEVLGGLVEDIPTAMGLIGEMTTRDFPLPMVEFEPEQEGKDAQVGWLDLLLQIIDDSLVQHLDADEEIAHEYAARIGRHGDG